MAKDRLNTFSIVVFSMCPPNTEVQLVSELAGMDYMNVIRVDQKLAEWRDEGRLRRNEGS
jgi:hypothetical protein